MHKAIALQIEALKNGDASVGTIAIRGRTVAARWLEIHVHDDNRCERDDTTTVKAKLATPLFGSFPLKRYSLLAKFHFLQILLL